MIISLNGHVGIQLIGKYPVERIWIASCKYKVFLLNIYTYIYTYIYIYIYNRGTRVRFPVDDQPFRKSSIFAYRENLERHLVKQMRNVLL